MQSKLSLNNPSYICFQNERVAKLLRPVVCDMMYLVWLSNCCVKNTLIIRISALQKTNKRA